jgi:hypothetical protein
MMQLDLFPHLACFSVSIEVLEAFYSNEYNFPTTNRYKDDGPALFPDGHEWAFCTNWARYARRFHGRSVKLYGFLEEENEASHIAAMAFGHDFAVLNNRYLIDGWARQVSGYASRSVFDLENDRHLAEVIHLYGEPAHWMEYFRNPWLEASADNESEEERTAAVRGMTPPWPMPVHMVAAKSDNERSEEITPVLESIEIPGAR